MTEYHPGGLVGEDTVEVNIDPAECVIKADDLRMGRGPCSRPSHAGRECQRMTGEGKP